MLEESAGMKIQLPRPLPFSGLRCRLALKTDLKSGVRIVTEKRNPRLVSYLFAEPICQKLTNYAVVHAILAGVPPPPLSAGV